MTDLRGHGRALLERVPMLAVVLAMIGLLPAFWMWGLGRTWPSSDIDGHVAWIEMYRRSLADGVLWPWEPSLAGGFDVAPYYGWLIGLGGGLLAWVLGLAGADDPARLVVVGVLGLVIAVLPWCSGMAAAATAEADDDEGRRRRWVAGVVAGLIALATRSVDGLTAYGLEGSLRIGLFSQAVALPIFLLLVARAGILAREGEGMTGVRPDPLMALLWCLLASVHPLTAVPGLVVAVVVGWPALRRVASSVVLGTLMAAVTVAGIIACGHRAGVRADDMDLMGTDPFLNVLGGLLIGPPVVDQVIAGIVGVMIIGGMIAALRRGGTNGRIAIAGLLVVVIAILPLCRWPVATSLHSYRFHVPAWHLLLISGAVMLADWSMGWSWAVRPLMQRVVFAGLMAWVVVRLLLVCALETTDMGKPEKELAALIPPGARLAWADRNHDHRWIQTRWALNHGWENTETFLRDLDPIGWRVVVNGVASMGFPTYGGAFLSIDRQVGARMVADGGVTHIIDRPAPCGDDLFSPGGGSGPTGPDEWREHRGTGWRMWEAPAPRPRLEAIDEGLIAWSLDAGRPATWLLAHWASWQRAEAGRKMPRMVMTRADDPAVSAAIIDDMAPSIRVGDWLIDGAWLRARRFHRLDAGAGAVEVRNIEIGAICRFLAGAAAWWRLQPASTGPLVPDPVFRWSGRTAVLEGLVPGRPYLWRYAWAPGLRCQGGRLLPEASGMVVVIPAAQEVRISHVMPRPWLVYAGAAVSLSALLWWAWSLRRKSSKDHLAV